MAMSITIDGISTRGSKNFVWGTFTNDTTTGNIGAAIASNVGYVLRVVTGFGLQQTAAANAITEDAAMEETLPTLDTATTINVTSGADGIWWMEGY